MADPPQKVTPLLVGVLAYLLDHPDGAHGYAILRGLPDRPDGTRHQAGAVYPVLSKLADSGWATREWRLDVVPAHRVVRLTDDLGRPAADKLVSKHQPAVQA